MLHDSFVQAGSVKNLRVRGSPQHRWCTNTWDIIIDDKAHCMKNESAQLAAGLLQLVCNRRFLLTGTPVMNSMVCHCYCACTLCFLLFCIPPPSSLSLSLTHTAAHTPAYTRTNMTPTHPQPHPHPQDDLFTMLRHILPNVFNDKETFDANMGGGLYDRQGEVKWMVRPYVWRKRLAMCSPLKRRLSSGWRWWSSNVGCTNSTQPKAKTTGTWC